MFILIYISQTFFAFVTETLSNRIRLGTPMYFIEKRNVALIGVQKTRAFSPQVPFAQFLPPTLSSHWHLNSTRQAVVSSAAWRSYYREHWIKIPDLDQKGPTWKVVCLYENEKLRPNFLICELRRAYHKKVGKQEMNIFKLYVRFPNNMYDCFPKLPDI